MNEPPKFIAWLSDGSDCFNHQLLDSEELLSLREHAREATGGNIEVHAYPLHAFDAMREALAALCERTRAIMQYTGEYDGQLIQAIANGEAALAMAKGEQ